MTAATFATCFGWHQYLTEQIYWKLWILFLPRVWLNFDLVYLYVPKEAQNEIRTDET